MIPGKLRILTDEQVAQLHQDALEILQRVGVAFREEQMLRQLAEAGAQVDWQKQIARFSPALVEQLLSTVPHQLLYAARNPRYDLTIAPDQVHTRPIAGCNYILDPLTGERREATARDAVEAAMLTDALEHVHFNAAAIYPADEPPHSRAVYYVRLLLENTEKHICFSPYGAADVAYIAEMASLVAGGRAELARRPLLSMVSAPTSPLQYAGHQVGMFRVAAEAGIPAMLGTTPLVGGTCPVTLAGALVVAHAEALAGAIMAQVVRPGAPVYYAIRPNTMNMRTGAALWGSVEMYIISAAGVQMADYVGIPSDCMGTGTDSKTTDEQAGYEKALGTIMTALAGTQIMVGAGYLETINTFSLPQLVIDDEIYALMYRTLRGIEVTPETRALDVIASVGPGGWFLGEEHTRDFYQREHCLPLVSDRNVFETWAEQGRHTVVERAWARAQQLLRSHHPAPLPEGLDRELDRVMAAAREELKGEH